MRTLAKILLAEQGKLGSCSAYLIAVFCRIHLQLATGQVITLHAELTPPLTNGHCDHLDHLATEIL